MRSVRRVTDPVAGVKREMRASFTVPVRRSARRPAAVSLSLSLAVRAVAKRVAPVVRSLDDDPVRGAVGL